MDFLLLMCEIDTEEVEGEVGPVVTVALISGNTVRYFFTEIIFNRELNYSSKSKKKKVFYTRDNSRICVGSQKY